MSHLLWNIKRCSCAFLLAIEDLSQLPIATRERGAGKSFWSSGNELLGSRTGGVEWDWRRFANLQKVRKRVKIVGFASFVACVLWKHICACGEIFGFNTVA